MLSEKDFIILENSLANVFDWESENLEKDFVSYITSEIPTLTQDSVITLFNKFTSLNPIQRDSVSFNLQHFIQVHLD